MSPFKFTIAHKSSSSNARVGEIHTPHGVIHTPAFTPVGTQGTVKSLTPDELTMIGTELFFVNTYHAYLRPGTEVVKLFGGLHKFIGWSKPLITDSGGFQVFSLGTKYEDSVSNGGEKLVKIDDDGVTFRSHWDGSEHRFTPESSIQTQHELGADIILCFDDCTPYPVTHEQATLSMNRTHRWAERSLKKHHELNTDNEQALYGIVQGSIYEDLRIESARFIAGQAFDGIAIGGVSVGETKEDMLNVCRWVTPLLPEHKPRHLLGVGEIDDIFGFIEYGIDTFDCVQPTRLARMGHVFKRSKLKDQRSKLENDKFTIDIQKKVFEKDIQPIDESCSCYTCQHFSCAYLHHLFRVKELLAYRLATIHNVHFIHTLVAQMRESLIDDTFQDLKKQWLKS